MQRTVTFAKCGNNSKNARLIIPPSIVDIMELTEEENKVEITFVDGEMRVKKSKNQKNKSK